MDPGPELWRGDQLHHHPPTVHTSAVRPGFLEIPNLETTISRGKLLVSGKVIFFWGRGKGRGVVWFGNLHRNTFPQQKIDWGEGLSHVKGVDFTFIFWGKKNCRVKGVFLVGIEKMGVKLFLFEGVDQLCLDPVLWKSVALWCCLPDRPFTWDSHEMALDPVFSFAVKVFIPPKSP